MYGKKALLMRSNQETIAFMAKKSTKVCNEMRFKHIVVSVLMAVFIQVSYGVICIESVEARCYPANAFKRISEYFTCKENKGWDCVVRTNPDCRGGLYFVVTLNHSVCNLGEGSRVILKYVDITDPEVRNYSFSLNTACCWSREIWIGLTEGEIPPIAAWKVEAYDAQQELLSFKKSYLWGNRD